MRSPYALENEIDDAEDFLWLSTTQDTAKFFEDLNCLLSPYSRSSSQVHTRLWTSKTIQIRMAFFRLMNLSRWTEWPKAASTKSFKPGQEKANFSITSKRFSCSKISFLIDRLFLCSYK